MIVQVARLLKKWFSSPYSQFFLLSIVTQATFFQFGANFKVVAICAVILLLFFVFVLKNISLALFFLILLASRYPTIGKFYQFQAVSPQEYVYELGNLLFPNGIIFSYGLSLSTALGAILFFYLIRCAFVRGSRWLLRKLSQIWVNPVKSTLFFWVTALFFVIYSGLYYAYFPTYAVMATINWLKTIAIFLFAFFFYTQKKQYKQYFFLLLASLVIFEGSLSLKNYVVQFSSKDENTLNVSYSVPEQKAFLPRISNPIGSTNGNSNQYALDMSLFLVLYIFLSLSSDKKTFFSHVLIFSVVGIAVLNILLAQSRGIWLAWIIVFFLWGIKYRKGIFLFYQQHKSRFIKYKKYIVYSVFIFLFIFGFVILPRLYLSQTLFSDNGGVAIRKDMLMQGFQLLALSPFFGFGYGSTVSALLNNIPDSYAMNFPFPVHNGYLHLSIEFGLPVMLLFFLPLFMLGRAKIMAKVDSDKRFRLNMLSLAGICLLLIHYCFQPIYIETEYSLIALFLGCTI